MAASSPEEMPVKEAKRESTEEEPVKLGAERLELPTDVSAKILHKVTEDDEGEDEDEDECELCGCDCGCGEGGGYVNCGQHYDELLDTLVMLSHSDDPKDKAYEKTLLAEYYASFEFDMF